MIRLVPVNYKINEARKIKHTDVLNALKVYFHDNEEIISKIETIANTNIKVWTVLFSDNDIFNKVTNLISNKITISSTEYDIEDASIDRKDTISTFVFRFINFPAGFNNFNAIRQYMYDQGFKKDEVIDVYPEKMKNDKIKNGHIRAKVRILTGKDTIAKRIDPIAGQVIMNIYDKENTDVDNDHPISIVRLGASPCHHCGEHGHYRQDCLRIHETCSLCRSKNHVHQMCPTLYSRSISIHESNFIAEEETPEVAETASNEIFNGRDNANELGSAQTGTGSGENGEPDSETRDSNGMFNGVENGSIGLPNVAQCGENGDRDGKLSAQTVNRPDTNADDDKSSGTDRHNVAYSWNANGVEASGGVNGVEANPEVNFESTLLTNEIDKTDLKEATKSSNKRDHPEGSPLPLTESDERRGFAPGDRRRSKSTSSSTNEPLTITSMITEINKKHPKNPKTDKEQLDPSPLNITKIPGLPSKPPPKGSTSISKGTKASASKLVKK